MSGQRMGSMPRRKLLLTLWMGLCGAFLAVASGRGIEIREIPRPARWVTDLTYSLSPRAISDLNATSDRIEAEHGGQLVVVVVGTLGGKEPRPFAKELFNDWKIGRAAQNDGVLIFVALEDHRAELLLGSGIDDPERQRASEEIMEQVMVPRFKAGRPDEALVQGARECARRIYGVALPAVSEDAGAPRAAASSPSPGEYRPQFGPPSLSTPMKATWLLLGGAGLFLGLRSWKRNQGRRCAACGQAMVRLDAESKERFLNAGERSEESLQSAEHDVWFCPACEATVKHRYGAWFSRYRRCPKCGYKTGLRERRVLAEATRFMSGQVRIDDSCAHCSYTYTTMELTPKVAESSTDTYVDTSASVSSSSDSGGGSSDFGGGSTDGGGSSGHW